LGWEILATSLISFALGIVAAVLVERWEIRYLQPFIVIEERVTCKEIKLDGVPFIANRIRVRNKGRSGAQGCKAYVESKGVIKKEQAGCCLTMILRIRLP
jgi:hypothetical protein